MKVKKLPITKESFLKIREALIKSFSKEELDEVQIVWLHHKNRTEMLIDNRKVEP